MKNLAQVFFLVIATVGTAQNGIGIPAGQSAPAAAVTPEPASGAAAKQVSNDEKSALWASQMDNSNGVFNIMSPKYGARCDLADFKGSLAAGSAVLKGTGFMPSLVGRSAIVWNAGAAQANGSHAPLVTTVASYQSPTQITLGAAAETAVDSGPLEIGTLDTAAIQNAYNDAGASRASVLIPSSRGRSCLTGAIDLSAGFASKAPGALSNPVNIQGQGSEVSSLTGLPGQDVLQWPDGRRVMSGYAKLSGLRIVVDTSLDVSSSKGGAGSYPGRITGQVADGKGGLKAATPPISPGPVTFANGSISQSGDGAYDELVLPSTATFLGAGAFEANAPWMIVGQPISIPSLKFKATITAVLSQTQVKFSPPFNGAATDLAGSYGAGLAPPWFVGNCGIVFPATSGTTTGGVQMIFEDLNFQITRGSYQFSNHSCAMFFQQPPYFATFRRITAQNFYYGYIEALPVRENQITWTPDTAHYFDINISATIPMVMYAGNHRTLDGINLYGASHPLGLGPFFLNGPLNGAGNSTVSHFYHECWSDNSGENQRWSGSQWTISGGSFTQCRGPYVVWQASQSEVNNVELGGPGEPTPLTAGLQLLGNENVFQQMWVFGGKAGNSIGQVNDEGLDNEVISDYPSSNRRYAANVAQPPTGELDGAFLTASINAPFVSMSDLFTRCADWRASPYGATGTCSKDPDASSDGNIAGDYFSTSSNNGYFLFRFNGTPMAVGRRLPQSSVNMVLYGRVATAGVQQFKVYDETARNKPLQTCSFNMTTTFAMHGGPASSDACVLDLSSVPTGDILYLQWAPLPRSASEQIAWVGFPPASTSNLSATTAVLEGTTLRSSCESTSVRVAGSMVGSPVAVSSTTGTDLGAAFNLRATVTSPNTVTVYVCGTGTPPSLRYNVKVY